MTATNAKTATAATTALSAASSSSSSSKITATQQPQDTTTAATAAAVIQPSASSSTSASKEKPPTTASTTATVPPSSTSKMRKSHSADDLLLALTTTSTSNNNDIEEEEGSAYSAASDWLVSNFYPVENVMKNLMDSMEEEVLEDENDNDNDDNASTATMPYFDSSDFLPQQNWENLTASEIVPHIGFCLVAGGLACFHPLVFVAGVLTAVGTLQAAGAAHEYCSSESYSESQNFYNFCSNSLLFCGGAANDNTINDNKGSNDGGQAVSAVKTTAATKNHATNKQTDGMMTDTHTGSYTFGEDDDDDSDENFSEDDPMRQVSQLTFSEDSGVDLPQKILQEQQRRRQQLQTASKDSTKNVQKNSGIQQSASTLSHFDTQQALQWVQDFYPPLPTKALERVEFHGLNANEFFDVFFSDSAPFGFQAFHKIRRDKNVRYGLWEKLEGVRKPCLLAQAPAITENTSNGSQGASSGGVTMHIPPVQERIVEYDAKTNSFLGPPFAKTTKVQRALQVSKRLLVMEMKTSLSDIPFSKNFYIMERWLVTSESHPEELTASSDHKKRSRHSKMTSTAFLTITSQVIFTQTCAFESTILKESAEQIKEISSQWNKMAQEGLKRTEETRRQRLQEETEFEESEHDLQEEKKEEADILASPQGMTLSQEEAAHENDKSIEIQHMGRRNSWVAGDVYCPRPVLEDDDVTAIKEDSRLSLSWKGKSTRRSKTGRRSLSKSLSNMMARRRSPTISTTSTSAIGTVSSTSIEAQQGTLAAATIPVPVVSVA